MTWLNMSKCLEAQMPSLLQRLGMGLGEAAQTLGKVGLDRQREDRLAKARSESQKSSQEFTTSERIAGQEFTASESSKKIDSRIEAAVTKAKNTFSDEEFFEPVVDLLTGGMTLTSKKGRVFELNQTTNKFERIGTGEIQVNEDTKALDVAFGNKIAARQAKAFNLDSTDFTIFKTQDAAAEAATQFRINARKDGTLDEFDTEVAKKGFDYINELAGGVKDTSTKSTTTKSTDTTSSTSSARIDTALERAKKLGMTEEEALTMMLNDPRAEMDSKEIQRRLGI
jgi:hypothetical protein